MASKRGLAEDQAMRKVKPRLKQKRPVRHFIRQWRKYRGLTQEQLAERIGMTHGAIGQLERGEVDYTQSTLEALAYAMMCQPADLIVRDPYAENWSIMDSLKDIPEADRKRVVEVIESIRKAG